VSDLGWVERLLQSPPSCLSKLERLVGRLHVDFAGDEGYGRVFRPDPRTVGRAEVRRDITFLSAGFFHDIHHEDGRRPRDMWLLDLSLELATSHATLARMLERRFGPGRAVVQGDRPYAEHGKWFYLGATSDASARLLWERKQPEWALPPVAPTTRADFLATLVDRLVCERTEPPIAAALAPLAAAAGAEVRSPISSDGRGLGVGFRPGLPLDMVVAAFRWEAPVAWSGDVHMSVWSVGPLAAAQAPPLRPVLGSWRIWANLDGWPRDPGGADLPRVGGAGPASLYDVRTCQNKVVWISIQPAAA
jgi:hypothetical protein